MTRLRQWWRNLLFFRSRQWIGYDPAWDEEDDERTPQEVVDALIAPDPAEVEHLRQTRSVEDIRVDLVDIEAQIAVIKARLQHPIWLIPKAPK